MVSPVDTGKGSHHKEAQESEAQRPSPSHSVPRGRRLQHKYPLDNGSGNHTETSSFRPQGITRLPPLTGRRVRGLDGGLGRTKGGPRLRGQRRGSAGKEATKQSTCPWKATAEPGCGGWGPQVHRTTLLKREPGWL